MSASKLICKFSSHPATFEFFASLPYDNITLNPANKKTDQSPSDFQTGYSTAAHATLNTEQLISHIRVIIIDTIASLQGSDRWIISVSDVHDVPKIHDILDNAV